MIIFSVGFIFRVFINYFGDLNVFVNYLHPLSLIYYSFMASFIVFINEMFSLFQISILPNFMNLFSYFPSFSNIFSTFIHIKYEYFKLSSIKQDFSYLFSRMYCHNIIDNPLSDDVRDTLDDSIVLHKNSDSEDGSNNKSSKGKGKGRAHNPDEGVSSRNRGKHRAHYSDEGVSSKNKGKGRAYYSEDQGDSSKNKGKGRAYYSEDHNVSSQNKGKARANSFDQGVASTKSSNVNFPVYGSVWRDQSNFVEGQKNPGYVGTSSSRGLPDFYTKYIPYRTPTSSTNAYIPELDSKPLRKLESNPVYELEGEGNRNPLHELEGEGTPLHELEGSPVNPIYEAPDTGLKSVYRGEGDYVGPPVGNKPIYSDRGNENRLATPSSSNTNITYYTNGTNHGTLGSLSLNNSSQNLGNASNEGINQSIVPSNNASDETVNGITWEREREHGFYQYIDRSLLSTNSTEYVFHKSGVRGKLKIGFERIAGETNDLTKIYLKYKNISKRKFYWHLWEKNRDGFEDYSDFKQAWDPKTPIMKAIFKEVKKDLSGEIKQLIQTENPWDRDDGRINYRNRYNLQSRHQYRRVNR